MKLVLTFKINHSARVLVRFETTALHIDSTSLKASLIHVSFSVKSIAGNIYYNIRATKLWPSGIFLSGLEVVTICEMAGQHCTLKLGTVLATRQGSVQTDRCPNKLH